MQAFLTQRRKCCLLLCGTLFFFGSIQTSVCSPQLLQNLRPESITAFANAGWLVHSTGSVPVDVEREVVADFFSTGYYIVALGKEEVTPPGKDWSDSVEGFTKEEQEQIRQSLENYGHEVSVSYITFRAGVLALGDKILFWRLPYQDRLLLVNTEGKCWLVIPGNPK